MQGVLHTAITLRRDAIKRASFFWAFARCLLYSWLMALTGRPLTRRGMKPGLFISGEFRTTGELLRVLAPLLHCFKEGDPGFMKLDEHLIADFSGKGLVGIRGFDQVIDVCIVEVLVLKNEGLAHRVVGQVPQVLGGKGGLIDPYIAWVPFGDHMLLPFLCLQLFDNRLDLALGTPLPVEPSSKRVHNAHQIRKPSLGGSCLPG